MTRNVADVAIRQTGFRPQGNGCGPNTVVCVDLGKQGLCTYFSHHISERIDAKRTVFVPDVRFHLPDKNEAECKANFRVEKHHIPRLVDARKISAVFTCEQGTVCEGTEGLCILLKRFAHPCRYSDMIPIFGRPVPELCMINNTVMDFIYDNHRQRIITS